MAKDRKSHGRRPKPDEFAKRMARSKRRRQAWKITEDGAGPRDLSNPKRHHRSRILGIENERDTSN